MSELQKYIYSVIAIAIICSIIRNLIGTTTAISCIINLVCTVILLLTLISPFIHGSNTALKFETDAFLDDAQLATDFGISTAKDSRQQIIREQTSAYILEKAASLGAQIEVDVKLDENSIPYYCDLYGVTTPYAKHILNQYITETFAIAEENLVWS